MRTVSMAAVILVGLIGLTSCHGRGIIELSRPDSQRCYNMLAKDGELLTAATSALDDYAGSIPGYQANGSSTLASCREHLAAWDRLIKDLYEKYGLREEQYRLDVFSGRFIPIAQKPETTK